MLCAWSISKQCNRRYDYMSEAIPRIPTMRKSILERSTRTSLPAEQGDILRNGGLSRCNLVRRTMPNDCETIPESIYMNAGYAVAAAKGWSPMAGDLNGRLSMWVGRFQSRRVYAIMWHSGLAKQSSCFLPARASFYSCVVVSTHRQSHGIDRGNWPGRSCKSKRVYHNKD